MVVRAKLRIKVKDTIVESSAKVNAGYESIAPEIIVPAKLAEKFKLTEEEIKKLETREYIVADGRLVRFYVAPFKAEVSVITDDRIEGPTLADLIISLGRRESLISDKLISELKIALEDAGSGMWRFRDEPLTKLRESVEPEFW